MKVAINLNTKTIVDLLPDNATSDNGFLKANGYVLLDIENAVSNYVENEDGTIIAVFRQLEDSELKIFTNAAKKENRHVLVDSIEVEYNGILYQGDEESQNRMSRAINGLPDDMTTISWKASDNSSQELTRVDLKEILFLAGQEQTRIWFS